MILAENERRVQYLNMFFVVHLLTRGRTTKKDRTARSLYCIDYGVCVENRLGFATDKNVIRQQRFAYDDELARFDPHFRPVGKVVFRCPKCGAAYEEDELLIRGKLLAFCPDDRESLVREEATAESARFTEEEVKIVGAIRSAKLDDRLIARRVADDVGCYVQKVAKFAEKLDKEGVIHRHQYDGDSRYIYYGE